MENNNVGALAAAINSAMEKSKDLKDGFNKALTEYVTAHESEINNLDVFQSVKRNAIIEWLMALSKEKRKELLGDAWENIDRNNLQNDNPQELDGVLLDFDTAAEIIRKFKMPNGERLGEPDAEKAVNTFDGLLTNTTKTEEEQKKLDVSSFRNFIYNIGFYMLSCDQFDIMLKHVDTEKKENVEDKILSGADFWDVYRRLKYQGKSPQNLIDFLVNNMNFNEADSKSLAFTIIILMHNKAGKNEFDLAALETILNGDDPYKNFVKTLFNTQDIQTKLGLENLISSDDDDVQKFGQGLLDNNLEIKISDEKFEVVDYKSETDINNLISELANENGFNQWMKDVFNEDKKEIVIDSIDSLVSAKADAIKSFIRNTGNQDLRKKYLPLLYKNNHELLSTVKLNNGTVEHIMNKLHSCLERDEVIEFNLDKLREFLNQWKNNVKDDDSPLQLKVNLGKFIWGFQDELNREQFASLIKLDIWDLKTKSGYVGYYLSNILSKIKDANVCDEFLTQMKENEKFPFKYLTRSDDKVFGECLFCTIYELIRTSKNYDKNNPGAAIDDVLKNGDDYKWFRNGLKQFFTEYPQNAEKDNKTTLNIDNVLAEVGELKIILDQGKRQLKFDFSSECLLSVEEKKEIGDIDKLAENINKILAEDENIEKNLNEYVCKYCKGGDIGNFTNIKRKLIKLWLCQGQKKDPLPFEIKFELKEKKDDDLKPLDKVNLNFKTVSTIVNASLDELGEALSNSDGVENAINTFRVLFENINDEPKKFPVSDFYRFICKGFGDKTLSFDDFKTMSKYVGNNADDDQKFDGEQFLTFCKKFKCDDDNQSIELINFMVENTDFSQLNAEGLALMIIAVMSTFAKNDEFDRELLKNILDGNAPYEKFAEALQKFNYKKNLKDNSILKTLLNSENEDIKKFVDKLLENNLDITIYLGIDDQNYEFSTVSALVDCKEEDITKLKLDGLFNGLVSEEDFPGSIQSYFDGFFEKFDINKLNSIKADAIKSFIENSKNRNTLKQRYANLLQSNNQDLLSTMKLNKSVVSSIIDSLMRHGKKIAEAVENKDNDIKLLGEFVKNLKDNMKNDNSEAKIEYNLSAFIKNFEKKLNKDQVNNLLEFGIWNFNEANLSGYNLHDILLKIDDGRITDEFLREIRQYVDFSKLYDPKDELVGECIFKTIYQLIRTSEKYDEKDPGAAIDDVLVNGTKYGWFRNGLKTFFEKAKYSKDGMMLYAKDLKPREVLSQVGEFQQMLLSCKMKLYLDLSKECPLQCKEVNYDMKSVASFVEAINEIVKNGWKENLATELYQFISDYININKNKIYNVQDFQYVKRKAIQYWWKNEKNKKDLGLGGYLNFELPEDITDLDELDEIILSDQTAENIILACANKECLNGEKDIANAVDTFNVVMRKTIFDKAELRASSFSSFIRKNFPQFTLSSAQFDSMLKSFQAPKDKDEKFEFSDFVYICYALKDHRNSLDQLANFLVTNLSFDNLNSQDLLNIIWIFCNNNCLQDGCSLEATKIREFLEGNSKCTVLTDALAGLDNIQEKLDLTKLKQLDNLSPYQGALLDECEKGNIKLEFKQSKERQQQLKLIDELGKDPNFDKFMKFVFTGRIEKKNDININNNNDEKEYKTTNERYVFFKENRIGNIEELKAARVNAIENFIRSSGNGRYSSLLNKDSSKLLSKVKLKKDTVVSIMSCLDKCLGNHFVLSELNNNLINDVKNFFQDWIGSINNNNVENDKVKLDNLGNLISPFCRNLDDKLNKQQFDTITGWDIWNLEENSLSGDNLYDILKNLRDRGISDEFLGKIDKNKSVNFEKLFVDADKSRLCCLFKTICQLIRTSKKYDRNDPGAAIDDVLKDGTKYGWFRNGLKTFFKTAENKDLITKNGDTWIKQALGNVQLLKKMLDRGARRLQFDINKIDTGESPLTVVNEMDGFVEFINKDKNVLKDLNDYIKGYFSKNEIKINNLNEFQNIKPSVIKSWWGNFSKNNSNLNDNNYGNFSLEGKSPEDLKKLNGVILNFDNAKTIVINCKMNSRATSKNDAEAAIDTFKNLLGNIEKEEDNSEKQKNQLSVCDVCNFIINNFGYNSLSLEQFSDVLKYVDQNSNDKVISGEMFLTLCEKFVYDVYDKKLTEDLWNFALKNVNFDEENIDGLVLTIIGLMNLEIMIEAKDDNELDKDILDKDKLENVLKEISNHDDLGKITEITKKLEPINLIQSKNTNVCDFAQKLVDSNLKIEFSNKKLGINGCKYNKDYKDSIEQSIEKAEQDRKDRIKNLIAELEKENGFDEWMKNVFDIKKQNDKNSSIGKIDNIDSLMSAKTDAIKKFISSTVELQKKYNSLLYGNDSELLSTVKLSSDTVNVILNNLNSFFTKEFQFQTGKTDYTINQLYTFLRQWTDNLKNGMTRNNLDLQIDLSNFIQRFQGNLNMDQLNKLISLNVWDFPKKLKGDYYLYNLLKKIDGNIDYVFVHQIKNIDFTKLTDSQGKPFGQCLFRTIGQLIRTSPHYKKDSKENIIKAINDVLVNGSQYEWVSKGLVSFREKDETNFDKIDIKNNIIKDWSGALEDMLDAAGMKLMLIPAPFDPSKLTLTAVKTDGEKIYTNDNSNFDPTKKKYPNHDSSQGLYYEEDQQNQKYYCRNEKGEFFCYDSITQKLYRYSSYAKVYYYCGENDGKCYYYDPNTNEYKYYDSKYREYFSNNPNYTNNLNNNNFNNFNYTNNLDPNFNNTNNFNNNTNVENQNLYKKLALYGFLPFLPTVFLIYEIMTNKDPGIQKERAKNIILSLCGVIPIFSILVFLIAGALSRCEQTSQGNSVTQDQGNSVTQYTDFPTLDEITRNNNNNMNDNYVPDMLDRGTSGRADVPTDQG